MELSWMLVLLLCLLSFLLGAYAVSHIIGTTIRKSLKLLDYSSNLRITAIDTYNEAVAFYNTMAEYNRTAHGLSKEQLPDKVLIPQEEK